MSANTPKISVCLPVYNGEPYLSSAIESIISQTETNWELVIVDDCSSDNSVEIITDYASKDRRIRLHHNQSCLGHSGNYSQSIRLSTGKYVKLFAQDDFLANSALEEMSGILDTDPEIGLVTCAKRTISPESKELEIVRPFASSRKILGHDAILYNVLQLTNWIGEPSMGLCRRNLIQRGFDPKLFHYADCDFWFHILESSHLYYLDSVLCNYRRHENAVTRRTLSSLAFACDIVRLGKKYKHHLMRFGDTQELFNARAVELISMQIDHLKRNNDLSLEKVLATSVLGDSNNDSSAEMLEYISDLKELLFTFSTYVTEQIASTNAIQSKATNEISNLKHQKEAILASRSWRLTSPLRRIVETVRGQGESQHAANTIQTPDPVSLSLEIVETGGIMLPVGDHMSQYMKDVLRSGDYEKEELRIVGSRLEPGDRVLELGTGIGLLSAYCTRRLGSERVFTYEANPELEQPIRSVYKLNKVEPQLSMCILGERSGTQDFYIMPDFWASSQSNLSQLGKRVTVPVRSFNSELKASRATFLIIDIEGGEYELLKIADLSQIQRIAIEIHYKLLGQQKANETIERIQAQGFVLDNEISTKQELFFSRSIC